MSSDPLTDDSKFILAFIRDHPGLTIEELNKFSGMNSLAIKESLKQLLCHGTVIRMHAGRLDETNRYYPA